MKRNQRKTTRQGAVVVEMALVAPLTFLILIGLIVGASGVFRYQQMAALAREGARWAAVRGPQYQKRMGANAPTANDVFVNAIRPRAVSIDPDRLNYSVDWNADQSQVTVTLSYAWVPEGVFMPITLKSISSMPVTY